MRNARTRLAYESNVMLNVVILHLFHPYVKEMAE